MSYSSYTLNLKVISAAMFAFASCGIATAEPAAITEPAALEKSPASWSVIGVAKDDVLNLRDVPSADSKILVRIPPDTRGLKALGCLRKQLALDDWMDMSKEARRDAQLLWCRVEYSGQQGWVAGRFLKAE